MNFQEGAYIYINKPYRMSSFGALAHIRYVLSKRLHVKRVKMGHAGTLDPLATGVLVLCTGKATKQIEALQLHSKEYTATLQLGATTPSYDLEHEVDQTYPTEHITRELIEQTLPKFVGDIMQRPPLFSACKVGGDRAYELARKGSDHQLAEKPIHIDEIELVGFDPEKMLLKIRNQESGEVFFLADKGLSSYMSDATEPSEEMTDDHVIAYPNPVDRKSVV